MIILKYRPALITVNCSLVSKTRGEFFHSFLSQTVWSLCCFSVLYEPDWQHNLKVLFPSVVCSSKCYLVIMSFCVRPLLLFLPSVCQNLTLWFPLFHYLIVMVLMVLVPLSTTCLEVIYFSPFCLCLFFMCLASHCTNCNTPCVIDLTFFLMPSLYDYLWIICSL